MNADIRTTETTEGSLAKSAKDAKVLKVDSLALRGVGRNVECVDTPRSARRSTSRLLAETFASFANFARLSLQLEMPE